MHDIKWMWRLGLATLATVIAGCGDTTPPTPTVTAAAPRNELAERYLGCTAALQQASWAAYERDCVTAGFVRHDRDGSDASRSQVLEYWQNVKVAFPDLRLDPQVVLVDHNEVFAVLLVTGTHKGLLRCHGDWAATDKRIGLLAFQHVTFDGAGHATDEWLYYDAKTVLGQVGVLPPDAGQTRAAITDRWPGAPIIAVSAGDDREQGHKRVFQRLTDAINAHQPAQVAALLADDAVDSDPGQLADHRGRGVIETAVTGLLRNVPDYHRDVPAIFTAGDYVIAPGVKTGTWDGHAVKIPYAELAKLDGEKIISVWRFYDVAAMDAQVTAASHE
jgi:predicted ester cyclase